VRIEQVHQQPATPEPSGQVAHAEGK
jgi:hypothetical protein